MADGELAREKRAGKLGKLIEALAQRPALPGHTGAGHTRWATHGPPADPSAHPHGDPARLTAAPAARAGQSGSGARISSSEVTETA